MSASNLLPSNFAGGISSVDMSLTVAKDIIPPIISDLSSGTAATAIFTADSVDHIFLGYHYTWLEAQAATSSPSHIQFGLGKANTANDADGLYDETLPIDTAAPQIHVPQAVKGSVIGAGSGAQILTGDPDLPGYPIIKSGETLYITVTSQTGAGIVKITPIVVPCADRGERIA